MLLEFKTKNYKSFVDEMSFIMSPAPKQKGLDYSVQTTKIGAKNYKSLCSAVVYGPNASGKTNIIGAMDTMKSIIMRGNIRNADVPMSMNAASSLLELIPNCDSNSAPVEFSIRFIENDMLIDYSMIVDLGGFLEKDHSRKILEEKLAVNEKPVFIRNDKLEVSIPSCIKPYLNSNIKSVIVRYAPPLLCCIQHITRSARSIILRLRTWIADLGCASDDSAHTSTSS